MEESLGKKLIKTRESAGITVDDAVYRAKIPRAVIEALESENFGFFTSPLYARSFLRQYGDYIGADVEIWIESLVPEAMIDAESVEAMIEISEPVAKAGLRENPKTSSGRWSGVLMVAATAGLIWGGIKAFEKLDTQLSDSTEEVIKVDPQPAPPVEEEVVPETQNQIPATQPEPPKRAIIVDFPEE